MTFYFPNKPIHVYDPVKLMTTMGPVQEDWIVQPKWNGKRVEIACNAEGQITLFGRQGQFFKDRWPWLGELPLPRPWFLDGELLRDNRIFVWDAAVLDGKPVYKSAYAPRLDLLQEKIPKPLTNGSQTLECIQTMPARFYGALLRREGDPLLEGIVWKNLNATNLWGPYSTNQVSSMFKFRFAEWDKNARKHSTLSVLQGGKEG